MNTIEPTGPFKGAGLLPPGAPDPSKKDPIKEANKDDEEEGDIEG